MFKNIIALISSCLLPETKKIEALEETPTRKKFDESIYSD